MYKFDNNYWIVHSYNSYDGVVQDCGVRRCNNVLKMVDPENGAIFSIPCVVDYDMAASSVKVTKYILTPNNHAVVIVQGNSDTLRLFKTNIRFMLSGRPFKLYGYQNAVEYDLDEPTTLLYLDLYLDEFRDGDNIETGIAENGIYDYTVSINSENLILSQGSNGILTASSLLNDVEVPRKIIWETNNSDIVNINENGEYQVLGLIGESAVITASLYGNSDAFDSIIITVGDVGEDIKIILNPSFNIIRQYERKDFLIEVYYNGVLLTNGLTISCTTDSQILSILKNDDNYTIVSDGISSSPQSINISVSCENPEFNKNTVLYIQATSMLG